MMTLEKFEEASELVKKVTNSTKLVYSDYLSEQSGGKVYLKPENMQHTGAYKIRGAYYKISTLSDEERGRGLITASAGNHACLLYTSRGTIDNSRELFDEIEKEIKEQTEGRDALNRKHKQFLQMREDLSLIHI